MSTTTKDPITLARAALPAYSHPCSPQKFTQDQLFAMLVLRKFFRLDYRALVQWLHRWKELRDVLGIERVPHYSTLCYAEDRLLKKKGPIASLMQLLNARAAAA